MADEQKVTKPSSLPPIFKAGGTLEKSLSKSMLAVEFSYTTMHKSHGARDWRGERAGQYAIHADTFRFVHPDLDWARRYRGDSVARPDASVAGFQFGRRDRGGAVRHLAGDFFVRSGRFI